MQAECGEALELNVIQRLRVMDENLVVIAAEGTVVVLTARRSLESDWRECIKDLEFGIG